ncbi:LuxR C-terminal-related transcriptional regulator [Pseudomonas sp. LB3P14]
MTAMIPCLDRSGFLPRLSSHHLSRDRLSAPLLASSARVKLLCSPAGSGKTALLAECLLQAPAQCRVCWLPLSGVVLSAVDFRQRLAETFGLASSGESELLGYLARLQRPTWLFLDDYCRVPNPELDLLLDRMLTVSSPMLTWWLGTRRRPQCNWPRLLLDDELYECERATLAFTSGEVEQLLQPWVPDQAGKVASRIIQRTGGWCAGVRIALLQKCDWSRQDKPQGRADTLLDYLEHELFSSLTPELSEAWRVLAHFPRFNARLCDHLFGAGEGAQYLRTLQALGCFIEPWRDSTDWLQIFTPFTQLLRDEQWPAGRSWHRRACQWFCAEQDWKSAFEQALLAEEYEVAVSLLQHFSFEHLFEEQTVVLLLRLHEQQGEELTLGSPQLVGLITAALLFAGRFEQATTCIARLAHFTPQPSAALQRRLIARWQALQGWLLHLQGRMDTAHAHFLDALSALDPECWTARLMCLSGLTQQALLRGELDMAQAHNREALCLARAQGSLVFEGLMELDHAQLLEQRGAAARAEGVLAGLHELLCQSVDRPTPLLGRIALRRGRLALSMGQQARAAEFFQRGLDDCLRSHDKRVLYGFLGLARLAADQGDFAQAFMCLRDAERLMQQRQIPDTVYRGALLQLSSDFWLQQGRPELACEALARVLKHYRGPHARQAPPATLELIPRIEYLLILAETRLHQAQQPLARLHLLLEQAHASRMFSLEAELLLAMTEVASMLNERESARQFFDKGRALASCFDLQRLLMQFDKSCPDNVSESDAVNHFSDKSDNEGSLSSRESQVLELIASGNSNQQIADKLFISLHTVKTHVRRIHAKLGVERRTHAVARARMLGLCG